MTTLDSSSRISPSMTWIIRTRFGLGERCRKVENYFKHLDSSRRRSRLSPVKVMDDIALKTA